MKGFKRILLGEKMPDKDDPKYKERYERDVKAGRKFAQAMHIDKAAAKVQRFADRHRTLFLVIVFTFVACSLGLNIYRITMACQRPSVHRTATSVQDSIWKVRHKSFPHTGKTVTEPISSEGQ